MKFLPFVSLVTVSVVTIGTGAFNVYGPRLTKELENARQQIIGQSQWTRFNRDKTILSSWLRDTLNNLGFDFLQEKRKFGNQFDDDSTRESLVGIVVRTATKGYDPLHSKPTSSLYTTKKNARALINVQPQGVESDYNHYRTTALDSTPNRAISILTTDTIEALKSAGFDKVQIGDLGENIYIDGVDYKFFEVGKRYKFSDSKMKESKDADGVTIEITERIEPCGNLCKLSYINDETLPPQARFENCKKFLLWLDQKDGLRGWYAKIIGDGGLVKIGDEVSSLAFE